jgi:mRNA interferase RelE/StbE
MYELVIHPEVVEKDFKALTKEQLRRVFKQFKKLQTSPQLGQPLGNKAGYDLTGYRKLYVDNKKIRIVYSIEEERVVVEVVAVGKREDMKVYEDAERRR